MADNITYANSSTGAIPNSTVIRTEDVGGKHLQVTLVGAHVRTYKGTQSLTLSGTAQTLTVASGGTHADIYCEGATSSDYARFWHAGSTPTASVGVKLKDHEIVQTADPGTFRAINGSGSCTLRVEYYAYE